MFGIPKVAAYVVRVRVECLGSGSCLLTLGVLIGLKTWAGGCLRLAGPVGAREAVPFEVRSSVIVSQDGSHWTPSLGSCVVGHVGGCLRVLRWTSVRACLKDC